MPKKDEPQSWADRLQKAEAASPAAVPASPLMALDAFLEQAGMADLQALVKARDVEILVLKRELYLAKAEAIRLQLEIQGVTQSSGHE